MQVISAKEARQWIVTGQMSLFETWDTVQVSGELDLSGETELTTLSPQLRQVWGLNLEGCTSLTSLPDHLNTHRLNLNDCTALKTLPTGLVAHNVQAQRSGVESIPADIEVSYKLDLTDCKHLESLPDKLRTGSLIVSGCTKLERLPDGLHCYFLDASNCTSLRRWGRTGKIEVGNIILTNCNQLDYLPEWMGEIVQLNIQGCTSLERLPVNLIVTSSIELAESGLQDLPDGCANTELTWKDMIIDQHIAFYPETITSQDVINEDNIELRRVKMERMGYEAFFKQANATELDRDFDPGGLRRLLCVDFEEHNQWRRDEPVVCLSVICPSTARHYIIRVPPSMQKCHQAAAWIAGFDDPDLYHPIRET